MNVSQGKGEIRDLLARYDLRPRKALGQHFLADPNVVDRIVRFSGVASGDQVVEVGAGTGTLTAALAATGARVVAYEVDRRLRPLLDEALEGIGNIEVRIGDATAIEPERDLGPGPWVLVANLPYNVGTPLLLDLLRTAPTIVRFVVMVQREVADRLTASPGSRLYGLPTVVARLHSDVTFGFAVGPQVFIPPPEVGSAVISLVRRAAPPRAERATEIAAAAFGQRRKMLRRALLGTVDDPVAVLTRAGIAPTARAETLTEGQFLAIAEAEES